MKNLTKHLYSIGIDQRKELKGHKPFLIWFTGLSGSGKSTLANLLEIELHKLGIHTYLLDGDNIRLGLNKDLSFSDSDRSENIRRIGEVAHLMIDAGILTIAAFVSPFQKDRDLVRSIVGADNYLEIFVNTPLEVCIERDTKGLYKKAIKGEIPDFTGISSPFETPLSPDISINTALLTTDEALQLILSEVRKKLELP
jgi:adenylylsulfate kinase